VLLFPEKFHRKVSNLNPICTFQNLQRHHADSLPQHGFLVYISDRSDAEITHCEENEKDECTMDQEL